MPHGTLLTSLLKNVGQVINSVYSHPLDQIADPALENTEEEIEDSKKKKFLDKAKLVQVGKDGVSKSVLKIIKKLLSWDYKDRPSAKRILSYKFLQ